MFGERGPSTEEIWDIQPENNLEGHKKYKKKVDRETELPSTVNQEEVDEAQHFRELAADLGLPPTATPAEIRKAYFLRSEQPQRERMRKRAADEAGLDENASWELIDRTRKLGKLRPHL